MNTVRLTPVRVVAKGEHHYAQFRYEGAANGTAFVQRDDRGWWRPEYLDAGERDPVSCRHARTAEDAVRGMFAERGLGVTFEAPAASKRKRNAPHEEKQRVWFERDPGEDHTSGSSYRVMRGDEWIGDLDPVRTISKQGLSSAGNRYRTVQWHLKIEPEGYPVFEAYFPSRPVQSGPSFQSEIAAALANAKTAARMFAERGLRVTFEAPAASKRNGRSASTARRGE